MAMRVFYYFWQKDGAIDMEVCPDLDICPVNARAPIMAFRADGGQMIIKLTQKGAHLVGDADTLADALNRTWGEFNRWKATNRPNRVSWVVSEGASIPNENFVLMAQFVYRCAVE